ncbi:hypothetical protein MSG28_000019 [Choristoneura fumiferana]|uniref:Uncharacterized protein n=1 Tax=Choristoneura fumiferana TaxID=7141 RepID=A0ACC0JZ06_CHOFU|nr:hypothetical protein MSG28_000019 [Choristoneura fumiferana]
MSDKIPYVFRQNSDFFYLTGCLEPAAVLVIIKPAQTDNFKSSNPELSLLLAPLRQAGATSGDPQKALHMMSGARLQRARGRPEHPAFPRWSPAAPEPRTYTT